MLRLSCVMKLLICYYFLHFLIGHVRRVYSLLCSSTCNESKSRECMAIFKNFVEVWFWDILTNGSWILFDRGKWDSVVKIILKILCSFDLNSVSYFPAVLPGMTCWKLVTTVIWTFSKRSFHCNDFCFFNEWMNYRRFGTNAEIVTSKWIFFFSPKPLHIKMVHFLQLKLTVDVCIRKNFRVWKTDQVAKVAGVYEALFY